MSRSVVMAGVLAICALLLVPRRPVSVSATSCRPCFTEHVYELNLKRVESNGVPVLDTSAYHNYRVRLFTGPPQAMALNITSAQEFHTMYFYVGPDSLCP